jgi:hypothetical protein
MTLKKILILFFALFFLINLTTHGESLDSSIQKKLVTITYTQPIITQNTYQDNIINIETTTQFIHPGYYMLPQDIKQFSLPRNTKILSVEITPRNIQNITIQNKPQITPQPAPLNMQYQSLLPKKITEPKTINSWSEYIIGGGIRDNEQQVILTIELFPIQYFPEKNMIQWAKSFDITIEYNPSPESQKNTDGDTYELLIISPEEFKLPLQNLVAHKNAMNIKTKLVSLDDIYDSSYFPLEGYDNQEQIKYFIKNAIDTWGISSVLLVGSDEKLPTRKTHIRISNNDKETFVSDLYYADIYNETYQFQSWDTNQNHIYGEYNWEGETDSLDLYPDIYIGRLACIDITEVNIVVDKIITYETNEVYRSHWFSDIIVVGGDSFPGDRDKVPEGEYVNEHVIEIMDGFIPKKIWASNGILNGTNPTGSTVITNYINEGAGFIDFSGHGNTNLYTTHPYEKEGIWLPSPYGAYYNSNIKKLANREKLPIVVTSACSVGKFNKDPDCFCWSFLLNSNGGAIGSFGATGLGYAYIGRGVTYGLIEKMALDMFQAYKSKAHTLGEMWEWGINSNIQNYMDSTKYKTVEEWQLFGDPTLKIANDSLPPEKPLLMGPSSGRSAKVYTYEAISTDADSSELFYCFDWGDGTYSEWLGPYNSGEKISTTHSWDEKGEYEIRVSVKDDKGVHSDWSDPLLIKLANSKLMTKWIYVLPLWIQHIFDHIILG